MPFVSDFASLSIASPFSFCVSFTYTTSICCHTRLPQFLGIREPFFADVFNIAKHISLAIRQLRGRIHIVAHKLHWRLHRSDPETDTT